MTDKLDEILTKFKKAKTPFEYSPKQLAEEAYKAGQEAGRKEILEKRLVCAKKQDGKIHGEPLEYCHKCVFNTDYLYEKVAQLERQLSDSQHRLEDELTIKKPTGAYIEKALPLTPENLIRITEDDEQTIERLDKKIAQLEKEKKDVWDLVAIRDKQIKEAYEKGRKEALAMIKKNPCNEQCNIHCHAFEQDKIAQLEDAMMKARCERAEAYKIIGKLEAENKVLLGAKYVAITDKQTKAMLELMRDDLNKSEKEIAELKTTLQAEADHADEEYETTQEYLKDNKRLRDALGGLYCFMPNHCPRYPDDLCPVCEAKKALEGKP